MTYKERRKKKDFFTQNGHAALNEWRSFIIEKSQKSYAIYITIFRLVTKLREILLASKYKKLLQLATMQEIGSVIKVSL